MTYVQQYTLATDPTFLQQVQVAMVIAARDVQGEDINGLSEDHYKKRQQLARSIILSPTSYLDRFGWLVAANPGILTDNSDGAVQFTVNTVFDDAAGVDALD